MKGMEEEKGIRGGSRGMALVIVLWVLTLLSVIALEFCFSMRTELNVTQNFKEETQVYFYAQGGVHRAIAELIYKNDPALQAQRKQIEEQKKLLPPDQQGQEVSTLPEEWRTDGRSYSVSFQSGEAEVRVRNEAGRINLNRASDQLLRKAVKYFVELGEKRDILVDSIQDWRDKDDLHRLNGAENDYYQSLPEPYHCKNGDFDTLEELLLVRGVTPELFYGKKTRDQEGEQETPAFGLKDIFTVFSSIDKVDVNVASAEVLMVLLGISSDMAKRVIEVREEKDFVSLAELVQRVPEITPYVQDVRGFLLFKTNMPYYTITAWGKTKEGDSRRGLECVVKIDQKEENGYKILMWRDAIY